MTDDQRQTAAAVARSVPFAEIPHYRHDDLAVGEHAHAGALRFFASGSLDDQPQAEAVLRRYLQAALVTMFVIVSAIAFALATAFLIAEHQASDPHR